MGNISLLFVAVGIAANTSDTFLGLARALNKLQKADPHGVRAFCKMTSMDRRKAYYLIEIDRHLGKFNLPAEQAAEIGWTKLRLIGPHATKENIQSLLDQAEALTIRELRGSLAGLEPQLKTRCVALFLTRPQHAAFVKKLAKYGYVGSGSPCTREDALMAALEGENAK